jgi:hypothetical protein
MSSIGWAEVVVLLVPFAVIVALVALTVGLASRRGRS